MCDYCRHFVKDRLGAMFVLFRDVWVALADDIDAALGRSGDSSSSSA